MLSLSTARRVFASALPGAASMSRRIARIDAEFRTGTFQRPFAQARFLVRIDQFWFVYAGVVGLSFSKAFFYVTL